MRGFVFQDWGMNSPPHKQWAENKLLIYLFVKVEERNTIMCRGNLIYCTWTTHIGPLLDSLVEKEHHFFGAFIVFMGLKSWTRDVLYPTISIHFKSLHQKWCRNHQTIWCPWFVHECSHWFHYWFFHMFWFWSHVSGAPYIPTASRQFLKNLAFKKNMQRPNQFELETEPRNPRFSKDLLNLRKIQDWRQNQKEKSVGKNKSNNADATFFLKKSFLNVMKAISCCEEDSSSSIVATVNISSIPFCYKYP